MKASEIISIVAILAVAVALFLLYQNRREDNAREGEIKKLKENFETVVNYDSIISASEKRMFDSLKVVREEFDRQIKIQHDENTKLRRRNSALEKRFNDLDLGVRPDF
jgi:BMFP domain-containing protein YqiC